MQVIKQKVADENLSLLQFPEYKAEVERLAKIQTNLVKWEHRENKLQNQMISKLSNASDPLKEDEVIASAEKIARGERVEADVTFCRDELDRVASEIKIFRNAIKTQHAVLDKVRGQCSTKLCERIRPQHEAIVSQIARAVQELARLNREERAFPDKLNTENIVPVGITPMGVLGFGFLDGSQDDISSRASNWMREYKAIGYGKK